MDTKKHIVIIDDNEDLLMMLEALLKTKGYKVSLKEDVNGIGEFLNEVQPDIILMDMLLSGADGREICKKIKADTTLAGIPLVMLSAYPQAEEDCLAAGANGFIEKPFDMKHLLDTLSAF